MIDEKLLFEIVKRYGCDIKKVENEEEAGFIDYNGTLKKSIFEDIEKDFAITIDNKIL